jgi:hypothetical protein
MLETNKPGEIRKRRIQVKRWEVTIDTTAFLTATQPLNSEARCNADTVRTESQFYDLWVSASLSAYRVFHDQRKNRLFTVDVVETVWTTHWPDDEIPEIRISEPGGALPWRDM